MITRELKLKLNKTQENTLNTWLCNLTGVYNYAIRKIELDAKDKIYYSKMDFQNKLSNHGKKLDIPSHTIQGVLVQAYIAWERCFKKIAKKPKLKSVRNKLTSIPFPDPIKNPVDGKVKLPELGTLRFHRYTLPEAKIKCGRIIKRASGWYLVLTYDASSKFKVKETSSKIGIDTGFKDLAILSDGTKIENNRYFVKGQERLAQAQRGKRKKLTARLHEKIKNRRKDYNHKVSRKIVEEHSEVYITNDNLKGQSYKFGKSVHDAGIAQLRNFIIYKGDVHGRKVKLVDSRYTTMTCSKCGSLTGPTGLSGLKVRNWVCEVCGERHDRDINASINILNSGLGISLKTGCSEVTL
jgi:IS605 OrfB family transposase